MFQLRKEQTLEEDLCFLILVIQIIHFSEVLNFIKSFSADYAWGREGLDTIVTQLLNQMDNSGPPPLEKEKIDEIPKREITQDQVDSKMQCSVCWEDFQLSEKIRLLPCSVRALYYSFVCIQRNALIYFSTFIMKIAFFHGYNFTEPALCVENYLCQKTKTILQVHPIILYVSNKSLFEI